MPKILRKMFEFLEFFPVRLMLSTFYSDTMSLSMRRKMMSRAYDVFILADLMLKHSYAKSVIKYRSSLRSGSSSENNGENHARPYMEV